MELWLFKRGPISSLDYLRDTKLEVTPALGGETAQSRDRTSKGVSAASIWEVDFQFTKSNWMVMLDLNTLLQFF